MEEEVGIKVTRLRRRLSVEADDVKSPSTQSTPTKKRGGRLAAKPQLELIDENATEVEKPKRTRKSVARDAEPEEKTVTPARRSARARSNTSLVSEPTGEAEDKGTPSRRSTRIKSNTSIVAETVQFADSPRAKRAARRTSQVGSDNEAPITPARQTRRTRKDSTSSIDKQVEPNAGKLGTQITEVIAEEVENKIKETTTKSTPGKANNESPQTRKSPRLTGRKSSSLDSDNKENEPNSVKKYKNDNETPESVDGAVISSTKVEETETTEENNLSVSSSNLIKDVDNEPKKGKVNLNRTASAADELPQMNSKRNRTKSWTTIASSPSGDNNFLSDTEVTKKKNKRKSNNLSGSGDSALNISTKSVQETKEADDVKDVSLNRSTFSDKKKKKQLDKSTVDNNISIEETSVVNTSTKLDKSAIKSNKSYNKIGKDDLNLSQKDDPNFTEKFFGEAPSGLVQSLVYIEDSDSNTGSVDKGNVNKQPDSEDQCVPVVEHQLNEESTKELKNNLSFEPMDIDETLPQNVSLSTFTEKNVSLRQDEKDGTLEKRKSMLNVSQINNVSIDNITNKSLRKSILSQQENDIEINLNNSKADSSAIITDNDINKSMNKSKRKSTMSIHNNVDESFNQSKNQSMVEENEDKGSKSKRKSSISNSIMDNDGMDINTSTINIEMNDTVNKSINKSKRKSSIVVVDEDNSNDKGNKSKRNSSISNIINDNDGVNKNCSNSDATTDYSSGKSSNKSKRKSSISNISVDNNLVNKSITADGDSDCSDKLIIEENVDASTNKTLNDDNDLNKSTKKSKRKSSVTNDNNDSVLKEADISKRKSVSMIVDMDEVDSSSNKSKRKSSVGTVQEDDNINKSSNKSKRKSTAINVSTENTVDINKSKRKSAITNDDNEADNSKRQSAISNFDTDNIMDKSSNKSKRKSSISHKESQSFDKSNNSNKSTLVLSQLKDMSETNVPKDIYEFNESNDSNEQLSKSANVPNSNKGKEGDKKNLSLTYSTSTPLQQKSMKKLGMQINTSIIAPNSVSKTEKTLNRSKKETSLLSQNDEESEPSDEDDEEESDEEDGEEEEDSEEESESENKSKMVDDEAEEASDDYESGDSRDEDEREYEAQNEIVEKGETLDSDEEEFSDNSDYERDSFIVDSDDEDNELLSGSGDDLSMSDNELSMSAKSKKKFNERKAKEQKKASREMFEARHKLNESDKSLKSPKPKKVNRQRLESSDSESDEEVSVQPKKNRRARIDSSQDISQSQLDADNSVSKKKKKVKRLSESVCEDVVSNEKEISIQENSDVEKNDPLSLQNIVKKEPKTPQKDLNISTVAITNVEEIEEVEVDQNASMVKLNQTSDPLQTTVAKDDAMEDDSDESISENEEITQNYESVLDNLNNESKKVKSLDISLNLNKKTKQKAKEPIVDQLNLTQVKKSKKKINNETKQVDKDKSLTNKVSEKINKSINVQDEGSSDSIDMKLLFNEDSTDGEVNAAAAKANDTNEVVEDFIPLKRTEGKTNMLEKGDTGSAKDDSILNVSKSKKNKRKSSQPEETVKMNDQENENVSFFIDTTGTHTDMNKSVANTSVIDSAKKKKQKNNLSSANIEETKEKQNVSSTNIEETKDDDDSNDAPLEVSYRSEKKNKSKQDLNSTQTEEANVNTTINESLIQSGKKKKKNKKSLNASQINVENTDNAADKSINALIVSITEGKKNKLSESQIEQNTEQTQAVPTLNVSVGSAKKQKKKTLSESLVVEKDTVTEDDTPAVTEETSSKKRKRKPSNNPSVEEIIAKDDTNVLNTSKALNESVVPVSQKKKRKVTPNDVEDTPQTEVSDVVPEIQQETKQEASSSSKKSKKKNKTAEQKPVENNDEDTSKNKKRKVRTDDDDEGDKLAKITKQDSFDKVYVPRLPAKVLKQLDDKPKKATTKITSTTSFKVEQTKMRRNKPSNYLEQSVYLNDSIEEQTKKSQLKKPKVLPFIPTASTSSYGFTTNFRVNVVSHETKFVAQSSDVANFKKDYLQKNRIKKLGTFEMYKRHRNIKISKF